MSETDTLLFKPQPPAPSPVEGFIQRLVEQNGFTRLDAASLTDFAAAEGDSVILLTYDPVRVPETLDVLVVLPEVLKPHGGRFRCAVMDPEQSQAVKTRFGITRWPALVFQRGGGYVGMIEGMRDWDEFVAEVGAMLDKPVGRAPSIGIAVTTTGGSESGCH